jgi:hypothetical protein
MIPSFASQTVTDWSLFMPTVPHRAYVYGVRVARIFNFQFKYLKFFPSPSLSTGRLWLVLARLPARLPAYQLPVRVFNRVPRSSRHVEI